MRVRARASAIDGARGLGLLDGLAALALLHGTRHAARLLLQMVRIRVRVRVRVRVRIRDLASSCRWKVLLTRTLTLG